MSQVMFVLAAGGVVLDICDLIWCVVFADNVVLKCTTNFIACLMKWLAFGGVMGVGTADYLTDSITFKCYNPKGMTTLDESYVMFQGGAAMLFVSGFLSLLLVPMSALHGER